MSLYDPLTHYLEICRSGEAPLAFNEVERILGRRLPPSARLHQAWWSNTTTHSHSGAWMRPGWRTARVDLAGERMVFVRAKAPSHSAVARASSADDQFVVRLASLSGPARTLLERRAAMRACSLEQAAGELLTEAAIDRKRRLLDRFPHSGEPSRVDSVDLIREERDGR